MKREIPELPARINRNILECKGKEVMDNITQPIVLIETYWNVKDPGITKGRRQKGVLIETYWNVKDRKKAVQEAGERY